MNVCVGEPPRPGEGEAPQEQGGAPESGVGGGQVAVHTRGSVGASKASPGRSFLSPPRMTTLEDTGRVVTGTGKVVGRGSSGTQPLDVLMTTSPLLTTRLTVTNSYLMLHSL